MLVLMFFVVFGIIVLTEIFLIGDQGLSRSGQKRSRYINVHSIVYAPDQPDYEENSPEGFPDGLGIHSSGTEKSVIDPRFIAKYDSSALSNVPPYFELALPYVRNDLKVTQNEWLPVTNTRFKFFVYSAYYDGRISSENPEKSLGIVRIIGATKTRNPDRVWCKFWYVDSSANNLTSSITVAARVKAIRENWNLKYSACFIICPLPEPTPHRSNVRLIPESVSVVARIRAPPTNRILVKNRSQFQPIMTNSLAVCVKPLHYEYNRVVQLIEFIELHRILGVKRVILYNDTIGSGANCVLRHYEREGFVEVLPWHQLGMISQREIRTEGLFAALNDCVYRLMYEFDYVALLDLDEFIIPRREETVLDLLNWVNSRVNMKSTGAYSFQNAFFYLQWPDDPYVMTSHRLSEVQLITLKKTRRRAKLHPHKQRSKYVCKPKLVIEAGNHFVWEFAPGHGTVNVPQDAAILHHYRVCEFGGNDCVKSSSIIDRTTYRYLDQLADRVEAIWQEILEICPNRITSGSSEVEVKTSMANVR